MISLVTSGLMDLSFLVPLQVFQTWIMYLAKATWLAEFAPKRVVWSPEKADFIYPYDLVQGVA